MCGIAGILRPGDAPPDRSVFEEELRRLCGGLAHRGPDDRGVLVSGGVGLAHTRLAVLDPSPAAAQPMRSPDGRHVILFNGEIYNFRELRSELEADGEGFTSRGDTEVVLRLLARGAEEGLGRLRGMFALALLDTATGEVLLARDRMGQKPCYLARLAGGGWAFASEISPLLATADLDASLSPEGLAHLLSFGFVPAPFTLRRDVRQLLPGTWTRLRAGAEAVSAPFVAPPGPGEPLLEGGAGALSTRLEEILSETVREHLVADVPVGMLLSGGVDSSTVAALAARHSTRLRTFSVVHRDPDYDERDAARAVARAIGSEHREIELEPSGLTEEELDLLVDRHGDPFADSSSLAVLRLAREMRRHVTVALSGDGGDEVFAGYPRYAQLRWISRLGRLPRPLLAGGERTARAVGGRRGRQSARALRVAGFRPARRAVAFKVLFWPEEQGAMLRPEWRAGEAGLESLLEDRGWPAERRPDAAAHWLEQRLVLPDEMLVKVDRMSMASALEVRPPLLGDAVLDFARRLPFAAKQNGATGKFVLRTLARRLVPAWTVDRPKRGFAVPLSRYGGKVFEEAARFALESERSPLRHLFLPEALQDLSGSLAREGEGRDPEDSPYRRVGRRWLLALLARALVRQGGVAGP
jgi:asparagine synthase (glutamine-hydrolysing)